MEAKMESYVKDPNEIERKSFEIIGELLGDFYAPEPRMSVIKRVIHTTADFEYKDILLFKAGVEEDIIKAMKNGCRIISDTNMIKSGINKRLIKEFGIEVECFVDSERAHEVSKEKGITRSMAAIDIAAELEGDKIFIIGNAPTALYRIMELCKEGLLNPKAVIGVPVGFVGAAESKEALWQTDIKSIITKGRKGGSTIGVAIVHAFMKEAKKQIG